MNTNKIWLFALIVLLIQGCSHASKFSVEIDSSTLGTRNLQVVYTLPDGNRAALAPVAVDGKVQFEGSSSTPSLVEIFTRQGAMLVQFMAVNGDKITITDGPNGTLVVQGSTHPLSGADAAVGAAVDTLRVREIIVARDSAKMVGPEGVWVFTSSQDERRRGAVLDSIKHYRKVVRDVYITPDFDEWRMVTHFDSATWLQGFVPAPPAAVSATPCIIVTDSAGRILRRHAL